MPERLLRRSASCTTPALRTRSVRCTMVPPRWTGWCRSRSEASRLPRLPPQHSGTTTRRNTKSTLSTLRDTSTSPWRWSGRCACLTVPSPHSAPWVVWNRRAKPSGARPTSTMCPVSPMSTRWTAPAPTSWKWPARCATSWVPTRAPSSCLLAPRRTSRVWWTSSR